MNKKIMACILALALIQTPQAQAGFFDSLKGKLAVIGLALAGLFALRSTPRQSSYDTYNAGDESTYRSTTDLADDPNDYQTSTQLVNNPVLTDCTPTAATARCSYLDASSRVRSNSCVNTVNLNANSNSGRNGTGGTGN